MESLDLALDFLAAFGKSLTERIGYSLDLKASDFAILSHQPDTIAQLLNGARHLVLVDFARVADGSDHLVFVESVPFPGVVAGGICDHKVRVQLWVEGAAGIVGKGRRADVTSDFRLPLEKGIAFDVKRNAQVLRVRSGRPPRERSSVACHLQAPRGVRPTFARNIESQRTPRDWRPASSKDENWRPPEVSRTAFLLPECLGSLTQGGLAHLLGSWGESFVPGR